MLCHYQNPGLFLQPSYFLYSELPYSQTIQPPNYCRLMNIYKHLLDIKKRYAAGFLVLIDPDSISIQQLPVFIEKINEAGVDGILVGGSLMMDDGYSEKVRLIKTLTNIPLILFPGSLSQIHSDFDALLYISLISGRNPDYLFGDHVVAAPRLKAMGLETISTAYTLINTGNITTVEFMSNTKAIPFDKPDIAVAHAIAAEMMGFKLLYFEAGSGADQSIPDITIQKTKAAVNIPLIVGGGIRTPELAAQKVQAGADFIVVGNALEDPDNYALLGEFVKRVRGG